MIENQSTRPSGSFDRVVNHVRQSLKCLEVQVGRYRSRPDPCEHTRVYKLVCLLVVVGVQVNICFPLQVRTGVSLQILQLRFGEEIQVRALQGLSRRDPPRL